MRQRVVPVLCLLIGLTIWVLVLSKIPKNKSQSDLSYSEDMNYKEDSLQRILKPNPRRLNKGQLLILEITRLKIKLEFLDYNFTLSGVQRLDDLLMEYGGTPVRTLIVSTWRSGSLFLGNLVNVMSSNFYHYEPLMKYGVQQIRGPPYANESTEYLKDMFQCDHNALKMYIHYWKNNLHSKMFKKFNPLEMNRRLWSMCEIKQDLCLNSYLVAMICRLFPFQSMKVVRYRLKLAKDLLEDKELNVKVVLLVRDPRAVMEARRRFEPFCPTPDCMNPAILCKDMVSDYLAAQLFARQYPTRFMVVHYEELMTNIDVIGLQLIRFLKLGPTRSFRGFLESNGDVGLRIQKRSVFRWMKDLDFDSVDKIQETCKEAMKVWDYEVAHNASHMASDNFYPTQRHSVFPLPLKDNDFDGTFNM